MNAEQFYGAQLVAKYPGLVEAFKWLEKALNFAAAGQDGMALKSANHALKKEREAFGWDGLEGSFA